MADYNPRSKNPRVHGDNRNSWSTSFDNYVANKREAREMGFRVEKKR